MKKILIALYFTLIFGFSYGQVNDYQKIFTPEGIKKIDEKINEIEEQRKIKIFVNSYKDGEKLSLAQPEKIIILALNKTDDGAMELELDFTRDIYVEEYSEDIDMAIENSESLLEAGEYTEYILSILDEVDKILYNVELDSDVNEIKESFEKENQKFIYGITSSSILKIGGLITAIGIIGLLLFELLQKRKRNSSYISQNSIRKKKIYSKR